MVVLDALHVACVNGSVVIDITAASAAGASANAAVSPTPSTSERRWDSDRNDRRISYFLSTTSGPERAPSAPAGPPVARHYPGERVPARGILSARHFPGLFTSGGRRTVMTMATRRDLGARP